MTGIARVNLDTAGGLITGGGQTTVYVNGYLAAVIGDSVASHDPGGIHNSSTMIEGSATVFINNIGVCRAGDSASCGHEATGSLDTFAN